jgi:hypothetical protein
MPRIKCHYVDCVFIDEGLCSAAAVELDPDTGCVTYSPANGAAAAAAGDKWEEEEADEWEDEETDGEEDDDWLEEEDEF